MTASRYQSVTGSRWGLGSSDFVGVADSVGVGDSAGFVDVAAAGLDGGTGVAAWESVFVGVGDCVGASLVGASVVGASVGVSRRCLRG